MTPARNTIRAELIAMLMQVREDWDCPAEITEGTGLFGDLGFESIDAVALGSAIEDHFNRSLPFADFLTRAREEKWTDISIGELTDFVVANLNARAAGQGR